MYFGSFNSWPETTAFGLMEVYYPFTIVNSYSLDCRNKLKSLELGGIYSATMLASTAVRCIRDYVHV